MSRTRNIYRNQEGQAMVEFALVAPILLLLVFGIVQFGILFNNYLTLTDAVRAGARQAAVSRTLTDPVGTTKTRVTTAAANLKASDIDITVTATYPYSISLLGLVVTSGRITSQTTERVE
jgi:Flp pilus assembly protein TadG